jgi:hypothetical protein
MKIDNTFLVVTGVIAFVVVGHYLTTKKERKSNASGRQIGTNPCASSNEDSCRQSCENMGGTYNQNGDRKCYKNGVPISGGLFGRSFRNIQVK